MRRKEVHAVAVARRCVAVHDEESGALKVKVGVNVNERIATQLHAAGTVGLHGKLVELRNEVGCEIIREEIAISTKFHGQLLHDLELYVQVREDVESRHWEHFLIA